MNKDWGTGYLYAAKYSNGLMKFGVSKNPKIRLESHDKIMVMSGAVRVETYISSKTSYPYRIENKVKKRFAAYAKHGSEWIDGVKYEEVVSFISSLHIPLSDPSRLEQIRVMESSFEETKRAIFGLVEIPPRAAVAFAYAAAIEGDLREKGYKGPLLSNSELAPSKTKIFEYVAFIGQQYRTADIADLMILLDDDLCAFEQAVTEMAETIAVHQGVAQAFSDLASRNVTYDSEAS